MTMKFFFISLLLLAASCSPSQGGVATAFSIQSHQGRSFISSEVASPTPSSFSSSSSSSALNSADPESSTDSSEETQHDNNNNQLQLLLEKSLRSFNSSAAKELVNELNEMRTNNTDQSSIENVLNDLLAKGPDSRIPIWLKPKFLTRFSKRARLASLRRTLDLTTPPPAEDSDEVDDEITEDTLEDQMRRRRRALVSLLRQLASDGEDRAGEAIALLEKKARREKKAAYRKEDLTERRPEGLETPDYEVVVKYPKFEIRRYEPFSVCSVSMSKSRPADAYNTDATTFDQKRSGARSFGALAGYLFGKNQKDESMAMTTPVLTTGRGDSKQMSFVLPSKFWKDDGIENAPKPLEGSGVSLKQNMGGERAVVMFGGYAPKKVTEEKRKQLLDELAKNDQYEAVKEEVALSQYNDPFTPPWKRLNEVSIGVRPRIIDQLVDS